MTIRDLISRVLDFNLLYLLWIPVGICVLYLAFFVVMLIVGGLVGLGEKFGIGTGDDSERDEVAERISENKKVKYLLIVYAILMGSSVFVMGIDALIKFSRQ